MASTSLPKLVLASSSRAANGLRPPLMVFNSLTQSKVELQPKLKSIVTMYVCGPTVYDVTHIGHGRTYVLFDTIRRVLRNLYDKQVIYAMNITDVDDKILAKCKATGVSRQALTRKYENLFLNDMAILGVEKPTIMPRATEYIDEMVAFIGKLSKQGYAYRTTDGSVYLDTIKANSIIGYPGKLGGGRQIVEDSGEGLTTNGKRNAADFALWKGVPNDDADVWDAQPWGGKGRPGWHSECSAMIEATLGLISGDGTIDIHGGGIDLCFPHHANERCQSQLSLAGSTKSDWASIFCHTGHVTISSTKMSKSLGNFVTIQHILDSKELTARQMRLLFLSASKYASGLEWNIGSVDRVKSLDAQLEDAMNPTQRPLSSSNPQRGTIIAEDVKFIHALQTYRDSVESAFADDFDFPRVFEILQNLCKDLARRSTALNVCEGLDAQAREFLASVLDTLGFGGATGVQPAYQRLPGSNLSESHDSSVLPAIFDELVKFRSTVRQAARKGDVKYVFEICDQFRHQNQFVTIQDMKDGTSVWKRKTS